MPRGKYIGRPFPVPIQRGDVALNAQRIGIFWDGLRLYYASEEWAEVRVKVLASAPDGLCVCCCAVPPTVVHHLTYVRVGHERWGDVEPLCRACHQTKHPTVDLGGW